MPKKSSVNKPVEKSSPRRAAGFTRDAASERSAPTSAKPVAQKQRAIQQKVDAAEGRVIPSAKAGKSAKGASQPLEKNLQEIDAKKQTGTRSKPPFAAQHQAKPGTESKIDPRPQFLAPNYRGSGKLEGQVALITGGDSGIGRAVAVLYAREGADVAIVYLDVEESDAQETCEYVEREGRRCLLLPGDVKDADFCREAVERTVEEFGKLDVLVNNAAFQEHTESLEDLTEEHFDETLRTNVYGYFHMAKAALPHLHEGASILNTGSETGLFGSPALLDYSTTKGAIHAFTKALATNLAPRGIRVNAVAPGPVWTPLNPADKAADKVQKFGEKTQFKRPAQPEEISPAYVFLAAPACASFITGIVLPIMGGTPGA